MNKYKFKVQLQNPPLVAMLCLLINLVILFNHVYSVAKIVLLVILMMSVVVLVNQLIWSVRNRKRLLEMELSNQSIKFGDKEFVWSEVKKVVVSDYFIHIRQKSGLKMIYYKIKKEEKLEIISCVQEITKGSAVQVITR